MSKLGGRKTSTRKLSTLPAGEFRCQGVAGSFLYEVDGYCSFLAYIFDGLSFLLQSL